MAFRRRLGGKVAIGRPRYGILLHRIRCNARRGTTVTGAARASAAKGSRVPGAVRRDRRPLQRRINGPERPNAVPSAKPSCSGIPGSNPSPSKGKYRYHDVSLTHAWGIQILVRSGSAIGWIYHAGRPDHEESNSMNTQRRWLVVQQVHGHPGPGTSEPEQTCQSIALACEPPRVTAGPFTPSLPAYPEACSRNRAISPSRQCPPPPRRV